jgi:XTP/dITP diphosphohydrolase
MLASHNEHKVRELRRLMPSWDVELLDAGESPPEVGATYYDNARAKAEFGHGLAGDAWVFGEDSGLEVEGLGGGPGIESARSGGADPVGWLLDALAGVDGDGRGARYVCELVGISPDGAEVRGTGTLVGRISTEPRGSEGFGYDPIFVPNGYEQTVAELGNEWKAEHSHRARAAKAFLAAV